MFIMLKLLCVIFMVRAAKHTSNEMNQFVRKLVEYLKTLCHEFVTRFTTIFAVMQLAIS